MYSMSYYFFRSLLKISKATYDWGAPVDKQRASVEKNAGMIKPPVGMRVERTTVGGVTAEWIQMPGAKEGRVLFYLHGGGYVMGSCTSHRAMTARLAEACGARALLLEYRLAPEHPFPAALEDSLAAYRGLLQGGIQPQHIIMGGDSAGGGLALATLASLRSSADPLPAAAVCLSPWTDLAHTGESLKTRAKADPWLVPKAAEIQAGYYCARNDPRDPFISPLYADLQGLPPILIQVGEDEILMSDSTRFADRARKAGVEVTLDVWPGMWHVWHALAPKLPEANRAIAAVGEFVGNILQR